MSTSSEPREPGDQEPAEGSRATVDAALESDREPSGGGENGEPNPFEEAAAGVSDHVPDA
jgi:hypothetical protein